MLCGIKEALCFLLLFELMFHLQLLPGYCSQMRRFAHDDEEIFAVSQEENVLLHKTTKYVSFFSTVISYLFSSFSSALPNHHIEKENRAKDSGSFCRQALYRYEERNTTQEDFCLSL